MRNLLRLMVIKIGQKRMLLKINHTKGEQLMTAAVKWLYMVGISEPQRNKRKKMEGHETYMIYKISLSLVNRLFRLQEPGKSFLDEYLHKIVTLKGLVFSDQVETTGKNRIRNKTNENFYCIDFITPSPALWRHLRRC